MAGEDHARQRSIMLPGFGSKECKAFLPIFKDCADSLSMKWMDTIESGNSQGVVINIRDWLLRGAFDAIGRGMASPTYYIFAKDLFNFIPVTTFSVCLQQVQLFMQAASKHIPAGIIQWLTDNGPGARLARARDVTNTVTNFAKELVQEKAVALLEGKGNTDAFTLLIKANMDANAKKRLSDEELLAQMRTLLVAGYETTANALSWILLELARNPKVQSRLRDEIRKTEATIRARGEQQLIMSDLEAMPYLSAVIKEGLRFHPPSPLSLRMAGHDDVLPLSKPLLTESGDMINEILVPKGTEIVISICAYNRDRDLWGEDAHEFNPDRWLDGTTDDKKLPGIGMYSNLLTFYSGTQGCIGWRFAVIEMQALLSTLVGKFEFAMTDKAKRIIRQPMIVMAPMIEGELDHGVQMPLVVSLASKDGEI
ncbi:cytochrome P450 [Boletus reticuloceps]|uniref:Cytochrome P450 n=1 Tax=Boletus reticuloceps TaxID=495285 RepID=A0A8I2Z1P5_9AGAM|nr:cytochrome P450 [Boletus reticuloceps]